MKFVLIISILLLISCKEGSNKRQLEFENYYKALPLLSPPLEFNNGLQYKWEYQKMRDDSLSKQLASLNSEYKKMFFPSETYNSVNGRIFSEKDFISIIYRSDAAVSYTHLDVYKRQTWPARRCR